MVAVVAGNGLGLFNTSLNTLGAAAGSFGQGTLGQAGGKAWVNASTGNLILRFTDEQLSGQGQDLFHTRTYNGLGTLNDGDGDGWRWDGERRVILTGTALAAGSRLTRTTGDGHETVYNWNGTRYQSTEGDGAHDFIQWDAQTSEWYWTDGSTRAVERYSGSTGLLNSVRDTSGTLITYVYNNDKLSSVTDSSGQALLMVYNAAGKLERFDTRTVVGGPLTQQVYYDYDGYGRLIQVSTDLTPDDNSIADGNAYATRYTHDGSSFRIASISQSDGSTASFTYVQVGSEYRVSTVTDASGTSTFSYDLVNRRTGVRNLLGQEWAYFHDEKGQLTRVQSPSTDGEIYYTGYQYDADGNVTQVTDTYGNAVSYAYDERGNRILERDPKGVTVARVYSAANQMLSEIRYSVPATWNAASGSWTEPPASSAQVTRYVYDYAERLRFVVSATGSVVEYAYDAHGLRAQEIVYGGNLYPVAGPADTSALSESSLAAWGAAQDRAKTRLTGFNYDYRGNLILRVAYANVDASGNWLLDSAAELTRYVYNAQGQLLQTLAGRGLDRGTQVLLSSTTYDGMGRVLGQMDASGTRTTVYNGSQRSIAVTTASGLTLTQVYDAQGRLIGIQETAAGGVSRSTSYYYDAAGRLNMRQDATGVRTFTFYDQSGRVGAEVDGAGNVTRYSYNYNDQRVAELRYATPADTSAWFNGGMVSVTLAQILPASNTSDRLTRLEYDQAGRLTSSTDPAGTLTTYSYDGRGQLIRQQTGERVTRSFYDADGRQVGQLDAEGYLRENLYNAAGQLQQTIRYSGVTTAALRANGSLAELRPASGGLSTWNFYDLAGRQIGSVDEKGFVSETVYNEGGNTHQSIRYFTAYTGALNGSTGFAAIRAAVAPGSSEAVVTFYDDLGRVSRRVVADGTVTTFEYDAAGRLVRETAAEGTAEERSTRTRYDAFGQTLGKLLGEASGKITVGMSEAQVAAVYSQYGMTWSYDAAGRVASVTDAMGNRTLSYYDNTGRLTRVINAVGEVSETKYNAFGDAVERTQLGNRLAVGTVASLGGGLQTAALDSLVAAIRNANLDSRTTQAYDTRGLLLSSIDAEGISTTNQYDQHGQLLRQIRVIAGDRKVTTAFGYNLRGEKISQTRDAGGLNLTDSTAYDAFGRVIRSTDAAGFITSTDYQDNGRTVVVRDPLNQARRSEFDAFGRTLREVDALGHITQYSYDDSNRSVTVTLPDGTQVSTWKTRHGETLKAVDGKGAVTQYEYNREGQLTRTIDALGQVAEVKRYDKAGRLSESVDARGIVTHLDYDAANRVVQRSVDPSGLNRRSTYVFDTAGRQVKVVEFAGTASARTTDYSYDRKGQLTQTVVDPNGLQLSTRYSYDGVGNVLRISQGTVGDPQQRITDYLYNEAGQRRFTVDALGYVSERKYDAAGNVIEETRYANKLQGSRETAALQRMGSNRLNNASFGNPGSDGLPAGWGLFNWQASGQAQVNPAQLAALRPQDAGSDNMALLYQAGRSATEDAYTELSQPVGQVTPGQRYAFSAYTAVQGATAWVTITWFDAAGKSLGWTGLDPASLNQAEAKGGQSLADYKRIVAEGTAPPGAATAQVLIRKNNTQAGLGESRLLAVRPRFEAVPVTSSADDRVTRYVHDALGRQRFSIDALGYVSERKYDAAGNVIEEVRYANKLQGSRDVAALRKLGVNQLNNASFGNPGSDGLPAGWGLFNWQANGQAQVNPAQLAALRPQDAGSDNMALLYQAGRSATEDAYTELSQPVGQVTPGQRYAFSVYTAVQGATAWVTITWFDAAGKSLGWTGLDPASLNQAEAKGGQSLADYKRIVAEGTAPPGAATAQVLIRKNNTQAGLSESRLLAVRPRFEAVPVTSSADDRVTRYVYDALGRQRFSVDALGYVSERKYDAAGNVIEEVRYANKLQGSRDVAALRKLGVNQLNNASFGNPGSDGLPAGWGLFNWQANAQTQVNPAQLAALRPQDAGSDNMAWLYQAGRSATEDAYTELSQPVGQVTPGQRYAFSVYTAVQGATAWVTISWFDASGNSLGWTGLDPASLNQAEAKGGQSLADYKRIVAEGTAPPGAATAQVLIRKNNTQAGLGESRLLAVRPRFEAVPVVASADDRVTRHTYDAIGQLKRTTDPLGYSESYTYDVAGNRTSLTNKNGQTWNYRYDQAGRLLEEITPTLWLSRMDSNGHGTGQSVSLVTRYGYDAFGSVISRSEGRLRATVDSDPALDDVSQARTSTFGYDALGRQVRITSPGWYDKASGQYQQNSGAGSFQVTTEVTYDALGNAVRNRVRVNNTGVAATDFVDSFKAYDLLGQVRYEVDALKGVTAYEYDGFGQAVLTRRNALPLNAGVPASGYYQVGDFNASSSPPSPGNDRTIITRYDRLGRKTEVQQDLVSLYAFTGNVATSSVKNVAPVKVYSYNAFGQAIRETLLARDSGGNSVMEQISTVNYYDQAGQRIGTVDALGYYTRLEYTGSGKVSRQVEYASALTGWSESSTPAAATTGKDRSVRFVYDAADRLLQTVRENVTYWQQSFAPNAARATMTQVTGDVAVSRNTYDGVGNALTLTDAQGNVTTTTYNALGQVVQVTEPARHAARAGAANPFDNAVYESPTTVYGVNAFGQVVYERRDAGAGQAGLTQLTLTAFDAAGHMIREFDAAGSAQSFKVDVAGRRIEETRQIQTELTGWRSNNQTLRRTFAYDSLGQQLSTSDWYDNGTRSTTNSVLYNRFGEVTAELLNGNYKASYVYNQLGNAIQQTNAQGVTSLAYDLTGKVSRSTQLGDLNSVADDRITYLRNDLLGRVLEQHLPAFVANVNVDTLNAVNLTLTTPIIRQTSDRWGNVLSRIDPRGYVTLYSYDQNNQVLTETLPVTDILRENGSSYRASLIHEKRYDARGQLIEEADLLGPYSGVVGSTLLRTRQHVYNQAGELVRDIDALGASRYYAMDANGNRVGTRDALGVVTFDDYDVMDRHTSHGIVRNGQRVTQLTNRYDQAGRLYAQINGTTTVTESLTSTASADGSSAVAGVAGNTRFSLFDERGNIVQTRNESNIQRTFTFNEANRKVAETDGLGASLTWTYDEANYGRLKVRKYLSDQLFNYTYNGFGQVVKEMVTAVSEGNSLGISNRTYTYFANGLVKSVRDDSLMVASGDSIWSVGNYEYDQSGQKVRDYTQSYQKTSYFLGGELSGRTEVRYKLDEGGRLREVKSPAGKEIVGGFNASAVTARVDMLRYDYDEFGNRRRVYLDTTNQSGGRTVIDDWYKYDLEGRVLVGKGFIAGGTVVAGKSAGKAKGYLTAYDAAGRRLASEEWSSSITGGERYMRSTYSYNDLGQVLEARTAMATRAAGADASAAVTAVDAEKILFRTAYDDLGNRTSQMTYSNNSPTERTTYSFRGDGQLISQLVYKISNGVERKSQANYFGEAGMIDAAGNQRNYRYVVYGANGVTVSYRGKYVRTFAGYDVYKEMNIEVTTSISSTPGWTSTISDDRGNANWIMSYNSSILNQGFAANKENQLTVRSDTTNNRAQSYLYYQGAALANVGNLSAAQITDTLAPVSEEYPGRTPGNYVVSQGDTLASIAQTVWGDSKMWYLIADANGIDPSKALVAGDSIRIPNVVSSTHNDATTFKPYNSGDVIGDTTPTPVFPPPPKPKKKKCGGVASIVMVVVAVVATVFTAGAAGAVIAGTASTLSTAAAAGVAAFSGTMAATGLGAVAAFGIGATVGSLASQAAGMAMGVVDNISWKQAAVAGLGGAIGAGITSLAAGASNTLGNALNAVGNSSATWQQAAIAYGAQGMAGYAGSYVASKVVGLDTSFSWKNMAASAVSSALAGSLGSGSNWGANLVRAEVSGLASAWMKDKWFGGGRPDYGQVAVDAFGNALADYVARTLSKGRQPAEIRQEVADWREMHEAGINESLSDKRFMLASNNWMPGDVYEISPTSIVAEAEPSFFERAMAYLEDLDLLDRASDYMHQSRVIEQASLDSVVKNSQGFIGETVGRTRRALNAAGYDIVDTALGMAKLVSSADARANLVGSMSGLYSEVTEHPMEMAASIAGNTVRYLGETTPAQIAEDSLRFVAGAAVGGAASKLAASSVVKGVGAGANAYRNSVHVASSAYGGTLGGGIYIPSLGKRITTVTKAMTRSVQGNGYLDPFTNKVVPSTYGEVLAVDHIFPVSEIVNMDGFKRLTKSQMTDIIQDRIGLGNLQALPQGLNSSKAASLAWEKYGKLDLHPQYIKDLGRTQEVMAEKIAEQIRIYNKLNAGGGGR